MPKAGATASIREGLAAILMAAALPVAAGCGGGGEGQARWSGLRAVTVSVETPSIPVPEGSSPPAPTNFTTPGQLRIVTAALNDHSIRRIAAVEEEPGCAGGTEIRLRITRAGGGRTVLSAYRCGGVTAGDIGGDLPGFLAAIGAEP